MIGQRFGSWVITDAPFKKGKKTFVDARCDCGTKRGVDLNSLKRGDSRCCGCLHKGKFKHGQRGRRLYNIWRGLRERCNNPNAPDYAWYGGRGITVCKDWDDYKTFQIWADHNGYQNTLTIDRIDNDQGYCPENCRWATHSQQAINRRGTAKYRGACKEGTKYRSRIWVDGRFLHLGLFDTKDEAALAWNTAAIKHRGANTRLNKVEANIE